MRKQALHITLLAGLALLCAALYAGWASPQINAPLGLDHFDEANVRAKVLTTAQRLLDNPGRLDLRLSQNTDTTTLKRMQELVGIQAAAYWARKDVPIQRWVYRVYPPQPITGWNILKDSESTLTAEVDSSGQILKLTIPPKKGARGEKLSSDQALQNAQDALRFVGADVSLLTLTSTTQGETEGRQTFDFVWKQPVEGFPGLLYQYSVTIQSGFLTNLKRDVQFGEEAPADPLADLVSPLIWGASWFFLVLVLLLVFIQKLRRDEVDVPHAQKVGILAGALTFARFVADPSAGVIKTLLAATLVGLMAALFFAFLWAVSESLLRQSFSDKLRFVDLLFQGHWRVREMGRHILWSCSVGLLFLGVPTLIVALAARWRELGLVALPVRLELGNLHFPGGLIGNALLNPMPPAVILSLVFLGVVYPLLRIRFSRWRAGALFCLLFACAVTEVIASGTVGPPLLAFALALLAGAVLFTVMERSGILSGMLMLYAPMAFRNVVLLISSQFKPVWLQGWLSAGIFLAILAGAVLIALFGRPQESLESYEPEYLVRMRERERFARELEIAKGIQERFLPKETPVIAGFAVSTCCLPAMEVGGDYYDFLPLPGGRWLLLLGDVSGKGVKAAFYMTLTKGILHAIASAEGDHTAILCRLNRIFGRLTEAGIFLTLCAVVLDPQSREVQLISAGHNPPCLVRRNGVQVLNPRGLVLGVMGDEVFLKSLRDVQMTLQPGDSLVLYTDGVTEAMNRESEEFGMERLVDTLQASRNRDAEGIMSTILANVEAFQQGAHQADDLTLLVLQTHES